MAGSQQSGLKNPEVKPELMNHSEVDQVDLRHQNLSTPGPTNPFTSHFTLDLCTGNFGLFVFPYYISYLSVSII